MVLCLVRPARTYSNGCKSLNRPDSGKVTAKGKGVRRETESEGSRLQTSGLTDRSNGMGYEPRKVALHQVIRGWVSYFKYADAKTSLTTIDQWLRKRIRMCIWKSWKKPKTRIKNLIRCGIKPYWANAEPHVRWCERSENESRKKTTSFSSYSIVSVFV